MKLVFYSTFLHALNGDNSYNVDVVKFKEPVIIKECRIIPKNVAPHSDKIDFMGETQPERFIFEIFVKNAAAKRFEKVVDNFSFDKDNVEPIFPSNLEMVTDQMVIRGSYSILSLCIYGDFAVKKVETSDKKRVSTKDIKSSKARTKLDSSKATAAALQDATNDMMLEMGIQFDPHKFSFRSLCHLVYPPINLLQDRSHATETLDAFKTLIYSDHASKKEVDASLLEAITKRSPTTLDKSSVSSATVQDALIWTLTSLRTCDNALKLKATFVIASTLLRSGFASFADSFVKLDGVDLLSKIICSSPVGTPITIYALNTLNHVLNFSVAMERFIVKQGTPESDKKTGYEMLVQLLFSQPGNTNIRIAQLGKQILLKTALYDALTKLRGMVPATEETATTCTVPLADELTTLLRKSMHAPDSQQEDLPDASLLDLNTIARTPELTLPPDMMPCVLNYFHRTNFLSTLATLMTHHSTLLFTPLAKVLLLLLSCRGGLHYIASNSSAVVNSFYASLHSKVTDCKVDRIPFTLHRWMEATETYDAYLSPVHLGHMMVYQLQSIMHLDQIMHTDKGERVLILQQLNSMATTDMGKSAVISVLSHVDAISCLASLLVGEDSHILIQYVITLLLLVFRHESSAPLLARTGPVIYDLLSKLDNTTLNSEFKGRVQQLLEWLKPSAVLKDKGVNGLITLLKSYSDSPMVNNSSFTRDVLLSLTSTLQLLSLSCQTSRTTIIALYTSDVDTHIRHILQESIMMLAPLATQAEHTEKASTTIRREYQYLRLLLPSLEILQSVVDSLAKSTAIAYKNTKLLRVLLTLQTTITSLPTFTFGEGVKDVGLSEYSLLVLKLATKIQRIISLWKWNEVLPKLLEHMLLTPQHYVGTMYLLCHLLSDIHTQEQETYWCSQLEANSDLLLQTVTTFLHTSCKTLYIILSKFCSIVLSLHPLLSKTIIIEPLLDILKRTISLKQENTPIVSRLLSMLVTFARHSNGKILLLHTHAITVLTQIPPTTAAPKLSTLTMSTLFLLSSLTTSPSVDISMEQRLVDDIPLADEREKIIQFSLSLLTSEPFHVNAVSLALYILLTLANYDHVALEILHIGTQRSSRESQKSEPMFKFMQRVLKNGNSPNESYPEVLQLIVNLVAALCGKRGERITRVKKFIAWDNDNKNHPLQLFVPLIEASLLNESEKKFLLEWKEKLVQVMAQLSSAPAVPPTVDPKQALPLPRPLHERLSRLKVIREEPSLFMLGDADFQSYIEPDEMLMSLLQAMIEMENRSELARMMTSKAIDETDKETSSPIQKKQKTDHRALNSVSTVKRDIFRSRRPNTSRPASVHVDDFVKGRQDKPKDKVASKPEEKEEKGEMVSKDYAKESSSSSSLVERDKSVKRSSYEDKERGSKKRESDRYVDKDPMWDRYTERKRSTTEEDDTFLLPWTYRERFYDDRGPLPPPLYRTFYDYPTF